MKIALFCALAVLLIAGGLLFWMAARLRKRAARVLAGAVPADAGAARVFDDTPMRHLGTRFADEMPLGVALAPSGTLNVFCTAEAIFIGPLAIPLPAVDDAALVSGRLRLRWRRGGEKLETLLEARPAGLERLRREIHLRQANVVDTLVSMLGPRP